MPHRRSIGRLADRWVLVPAAITVGVIILAAGFDLLHFPFGG